MIKRLSSVFSPKQAEPEETPIKRVSSVSISRASESKEHYDAKAVKAAEAAEHQRRVVHAKLREEEVIEKATEEERAEQRRIAAEPAVNEHLAEDTHGNWVVMRGWLWKQSGGKSSISIGNMAQKWDKRYFVLREHSDDHDGDMCYYKNQHDPANGVECAGHMKVKGATVRKLGSTGNVFTITSAERTLTCRADPGSSVTADAEGWIRALVEHGCEREEDGEEIGETHFQRLSRTGDDTSVEGGGLLRRLSSFGSPPAEASGSAVDKPQILSLTITRGSAAEPFGLELSDHNRVKTVTPDSPAFESGLKPMDRILECDDVVLTGSLVTAIESKTDVSLRVERPPSSAFPLIIARECVEGAKPFEFKSGDVK